MNNKKMYICIMIGLLIVLPFAGAGLQKEIYYRTFMDVVASHPAQEIYLASISVYNEDMHQSIELTQEERETLSATLMVLKRNDFQKISQSDGAVGACHLYLRWTDQTELLLQNEDGESLYRIMTDEATGRSLKGSYALRSTEIKNLMDKKGNLKDE